VTARVALIGCGAIAVRSHLPSLRAAGAEVVVFCSRSPESATAAASRWGSGEAVTDWRAVVRRDDVDAVVVCTPNALHAAVSVEAARHGKHVLVEKPMAVTLAEADAMIAAARSAGVILMVAHNMRFAPAVMAMRESLLRGDAGEVIGFRAAFGHAGPLAWSPGSAWFVDAAQSGGGALIDLGVHVADTVRWLVGDEFVECAAMLGPSLRPGVEGSADVVLRCAGGCVGTLHASWVTAAGPDLQITLLGTRGTLHHDAAAGVPLLLRPGVAAAPLPIDAVAPSDPCVEFVRRIDGSGGDAAIAPTARDGRAALAVVEAAYRAAASGTTVAIDSPS
jgi:predicted dehydrogenase